MPTPLIANVLSHRSLAASPGGVIEALRERFEDLTVELMLPAIEGKHGFYLKVDGVPVIAAFEGFPLGLDELKPWHGYLSDADGPLNAWAALDHPESVRAIHLNYLLVQPDAEPATDEERRWKAAFEATQKQLGAYAQLQGTRPQWPTTQWRRRRRSGPCPWAAASRSPHRLHGLPRPPLPVAAPLVGGARLPPHPLAGAAPRRALRGHGGAGPVRRGHARLGA